MPANLSPDYKKAELAYRAARDDGERLACLREMLRTIPKHKGTEHLQADLKSRIKQLGDELSGPKKGAARGGPVHVIRPDGAAQIALLGPPNSGKSALHTALTHSRASVGPYPYSTHEPQPGMLPYLDIHFQLVDLPPISPEYFEPWMVNALQPADAAWLVIDIADPDCTEQLGAVMSLLEGKRITLTEVWPASLSSETGASIDAGTTAADEALEEARALDPFRIYLPTLLVVNKIDLNNDSADIAVLKDLTGVRFPALAVSAQSGAGLEALGPFVFKHLGIVRVYTKTPGKPAAMEKPFTLRAGATVLDVARLVHKDIADSLRYARAWGSAVFDGQQVGPEHPVQDGDVVELHMR
jgi:ribosome-interacting GTPase 1